jgi:hypothetical protein
MMADHLPRLLRLRPDRAAVYAASGTLLRFATGPVTMIVIATALNASEQGFYFTFFNVFAAYQLIEAGMGFVATQGIASRMQGIDLQDGALTGDHHRIEAIHGRIGFVLIWFLLVGLLSAGPIYLGGQVLFHPETGVAWQTPWALYVAVSAAGIAMAALGGVLEGLQRPHLAFRAQLAGSVGSAVALWTCLAGGLGLYALPISGACSTLILGMLLIWPMRRIIPASITRYTRSPRDGCVEFVQIFRDGWPFFSRIAVTWILGFFYWNTLSLVAFAAFGAVYAGQLGFSVALLRVGLQFTESFLASQRGRLSALLATSPRDAWVVFQSRGRIAHVVLVAGYLIFFAVYGILPEKLVGRMLPLDVMGIYAVAYLAMLYPLNAALFLRCTGREVFFWYSLTLNVALPAAILATAALDQPLGVAIVFAVVHIAFVPWARSLISRAGPVDGSPG